MALMDDGLELSMGYHAINNIFAALILTNEWQAFQTDALFYGSCKTNFRMGCFINDYSNSTTFTFYFRENL